jgi:hypothetical protein
MLNPPCPSADSLDFFSRFARFLTGMAALGGFFSGAVPVPVSGDLTEAELTGRLRVANDPVHQFVRTLEKSITSGSIEAAEALVDRDAILTLATRRVNFEGGETVRELFCDSTRRAWDERGITRDYAGTKFRFLRARTLDGRAGLLFRSSERDGNINYALFTVRAGPQGELRITDIFVVGLNEFLSDTLRRTWLNVAAGFLDERAGSIEGVNPAYIAHISQIAEMSRQLNDGKYEEVLKSAARLPSSVQHERTVLLVRMEAAERVSIAERDAAYAAWLGAYPDEMELPLKFVDFYVSSHRWDDAERVLRSLISRLGEDALLKMELGRVIFQRAHEQQLANAGGVFAR